MKFAFAIVFANGTQTFEIPVENMRRALTALEAAPAIAGLSDPTVRLAIAEELAMYLVAPFIDISGEPADDVADLDRLSSGICLLLHGRVRSSLNRSPSQKSDS